MGVKKRTHKDVRVLLSLVERWREQGVLTPLERDLALAKLSSVYESMLLSSLGEDEQPSPFEDELLEQETSLDYKDEEDTELELEPEVEVELIFDEESDTDEQQEEQSCDEDVATEQEEQSCDEDVATEQEEQSCDDLKQESVIDSPEEQLGQVEQTISEEFSFVAKSKSARRAAILSLYEDEQPADMGGGLAAQSVVSEEKESKEIEEMEESPVEPRSLADFVKREVEDKEDGCGEIIAETISQISKGEESVADALKHTITPNIAERLSSLSSSVSLNDKYEIANELFKGEVQELVELLNHLDGFESFDECVIYISENYSISSDSRAAQMLLSLLERRFA